MKERTTLTRRQEAATQEAATVALTGDDMADVLITLRLQTEAQAKHSCPAPRS